MILQHDVVQLYNKIIADLKERNLNDSWGQFLDSISFIINHKGLFEEPYKQQLRDHYLRKGWGVPHMATTLDVFKGRNDLVKQIAVAFITASYRMEAGSRYRSLLEIDQDSSLNEKEKARAYRNYIKSRITFLVIKQET